MKNLREAVVFAILMENGRGILNKAPSYILEKMKSVDMGMPELLLDSPNMQKFQEYQNIWGSLIDEEK